MRNTVAGLLAMVVCACGLQAHAQQGVPLQHEYYVGDGDVDLHKGIFVYSNEDVAIGPKDQDAGLSLSRYFGVHQQAGSEAPFGANSGHNFEISLYRDKYLKEGSAPPNWSYDIALVIGRSVARLQYTNFPTVTLSGSPYSYPYQAATTLVTSNGAEGPFVYTTEDGTRIEFPDFDGTSCANIGFNSKTCTRASAIVKPNGERLTLAYESVSIRRRLRSVTSTRGYAIGFDYRDADASAPVTKVCVVNLSVQYMAPGGPCPAGVRAVTYSYVPTSYATTGLQSYSDASGATTNYSYKNGTDFWTMTGIRDPGSAVDNLTLNYDSNYKVASQVYADGSTWSYSYQGLGSWPEYPQNDWTEVSNPLGQMTRHEFGGGGSPKPRNIKDPLNRTQRYEFVENRPHLIFREISPDGNYTD